MEICSFTQYHSKQATIRLALLQSEHHGWLSIHCYLSIRNTIDCVGGQTVSDKRLHFLCVSRLRPRPKLPSINERFVCCSVALAHTDLGKAVQQTPELSGVELSIQKIFRGCL